MKRSILYLHGFRSSPASAKASRFREAVGQIDTGLSVMTPALPPDPQLAIAQCEILLARQDMNWCGIVGSSLGGFYALWLATRVPLPIVLINPAVYPYKLFADYLGPQENLYTGERFEVTPEHIESLRAFDVPGHEAPRSMLMLLQTGDETLDYSEAVCKYPHASAWVQPGGSHAFEGFRERIGSIVQFLLSHCASARNP